MKDYAVVQTQDGKVLMLGKITLVEKFFYLDREPSSYHPTRYALPGGGSAELPKAIEVARDLDDKAKPYSPIDAYFNGMEGDL